MKSLLCLVALVGALMALDLSEEAVKALFDDLIAEDGLGGSFKGATYDYRLALFAFNVQATEDRALVELDLAYTIDELEGMNGAKDHGTQALEEVVKREAPRLASFSAPPRKDNKGLLGPAVHQGGCGNCYLHTFVAALEAAYFKATGQRVKFSEQEMTDCYYAGCGGGDYKMVANTFSYWDKLSARSKYGDYLEGVYTCRSDTTPDALKKLKVTGFVPVAPDQIAAAVAMYGSVMTCMAWGVRASEPCYMSRYTAGTVVDYPPLAPGDNDCVHAVLIIGYDSSTWTVRNSHGADWGDNGHFKIARGKNVCGIEDPLMLGAVTTEAIGPRAKPLPASGCPGNKPKFCAAINTCVPGRMACVNANPKEEELEELEVQEEELQEELEAEVEVELEAEVEEELEAEVEEELEAEVEEVEEEEELEEMEKRSVRIPGLRKKRDEEERRRAGNNNNGEEELEERRKNNNNMRIFGREKRENEELEERAGCSDKAPAASCRKMCSSANAKNYCAKTCNLCSAVGVQQQPPADLETKGVCAKPTIPNGRALNRPMMKTGEVLKVQCSGGYTLVGETVKCLIANVFTNADKDARIFPQCIRVGGNQLVDNGATYRGTKNTFLTQSMNGGISEMECDVWDLDVLRGILIGDVNGGNYKLGNHNYCRNPGGAHPVPYCLGTESADTGAQIRYCFPGPVGSCAGATDEMGGGCAGIGPAECTYTSPLSRANNDYWWTNCKATCCSVTS